MKYALITMYVHWVKLLLMFGRHKTVISTTLRPTVIFTEELLTVSTGWVEKRCWLNIYLYS